MKYRRVDRRRFIRFDLDANVKFRFFNDMNSDESMKGKAKNLSAEGVCISTEKEIPRDKDVQVDIRLPGKKKEVRVQGKVVWVKTIHSGTKRVGDHYEAGIKLYTVDKEDENTLLKYYCEQMVDNLSQYLHL
ncbi:MAG: PilZ domain-containing protein [Candidatus Omnitrophica bacterium]|nr:PilZ domain-containing protein [Candidatus Omnitrophota bacterium]